MAEKNERLGLLLIFDCIATVLATFGVLLIFQMLITHEINTNTMILSCFFVGVKLLLMGICDITGIGRHLVVALLFIVIADCIAFAINFLMVFGLSNKLLLITLVVDAVMILISHLIWSKAFSGKHREKRERKEWLNERDIEREDDEYEDIFENVSAKEQAAAKEKEHEEFDGLFEDDDALEEFDYEEEVFEDEDEIFEEDDFDEDAEEDLDEVLPESRDEAEDFDDDAYLDEEAFKSLLISDDDLLKMEDAIEETPVEAFEEPEEVEEPAEEFFEEEAGLEEEAVVEDSEDTASEEESVVSDEPEEKVLESPTLEMLMLDGSTDVEAQEESAQDLTRIEERLGSLLEEINASTVETGKLEKSVEAFKDELDQLTPITKDSDIIETGDVIREKLKNIIDKQFIVDEVLDDLIRLSGQINKRIDDLDAIEADLNRRSEMLDKKEFLFMSRKNSALADVQVAEQEVVLENEESEIIIDQDDLEKIKNYLKEHPEL